MAYLNPNISQELRRMNDGLRGDWRNFDHILDIAYGRRGKLRHELLEVCPRPLP